MTEHAEPAHGAAPQEPAHDEPAPASTSPELIDERAKRIVAEHRADVNERTAEAAEAANAELLAKNEQLIRENGRKDGVIEVLKEKIQEKPRADPEARPATAAPAAEVTQSRVTFRQRIGHSTRYGLLAVLLLCLVVLLYFEWKPISAIATSLAHSVASFFSQSEKPPQPSITTSSSQASSSSEEISSEPSSSEGSSESSSEELSQDPTECTVPGSVYVDVLERCVLYLQ